MCRISVIIPVYNVKNYLRQCIDSVLNQTFRDFEIILVDDGSNDGSETICNYYADEYKNISVLHQNNSGPATSRKNGVSISKGCFIVFVDADDYIESNMLDLFIKEADISKADVVTCGYEDFYPSGRRIRKNKLDTDYIDIGTYEECIVQIHSTRNLICGPWCKLIKKDLFDGISWFEQVTIGEDYAMCLELFRNARKLRITDECLYHRRMSGTNISRSGYTDRHRNALKNYMAIRNELIKMYPQYKKDVIGYHVEYEMAVITAMCRNGNYDRQVELDLKNDIKANLKFVLDSRHVPLLHKLSSTLISISPELFILLFRPFHLITGR